MYFIDFIERKWRDRVRKKHGLFASHTRLKWGLNPKLGHVHNPENEFLTWPRLDWLGMV